jgi:hypothetical protein
VATLRTGNRLDQTSTKYAVNAAAMIADTVTPRRVSARTFAAVSVNAATLRHCRTGVNGRLANNTARSARGPMHLTGSKASLCGFYKILCGGAQQ